MILLKKPLEGRCLNRVSLASLLSTPMLCVAGLLSSLQTLNPGTINSPGVKYYSLNGHVMLLFLYTMGHVVHTSFISFSLTFSCDPLVLPYGSEGWESLESSSIYKHASLRWTLNRGMQAKPL